jgi:glycosyltransferase involved in cell wall biosynthesis
MKVIFFHRKRFPGNYSIESLFEQVRSVLPSEVAFSVKELRFHSNGFFKRLYIAIEAALNQQEVNHITGDVHFIALFLRKQRTVLTIHDLGFMDHPSSVARLLYKWFWITLPIKRCAVITVISEATRMELLKYIGEGYESRIHVIHNPVKGGFAPLAKTFNKKEPVILQLGTKYNKNLSRLIKALAGIKCKLEIVGELSVKVMDELKHNRITFELFKNLTDDQIVGKYATADIVSFVSTNEGFGLPIVEANAIGRVVVTSNISSMPEVAGNAAHLVDPFDVVSIREGFLKVINDDSYREKLILNGFENRKRFDAVKIANQYAALYHSLID